jgi:hypothetical protein
MRRLDSVFRCPIFGLVEWLATGWHWGQIVGIFSTVNGDTICYIIMFGGNVLGLNRNVVLVCNEKQFPNDSYNPIGFGSRRVNITWTTAEL